MVNYTIWIAHLFEKGWLPNTPKINPIKHLTMKLLQNQRYWFASRTYCLEESPSTRRRDRLEVDRLTQTKLEQGGPPIRSPPGFNCRISMMIFMYPALGGQLAANTKGSVEWSCIYLWESYHYTLFDLKFGWDFCIVDKVESKRSPIIKLELFPRFCV